MAVFEAHRATLIIAHRLSAVTLADLIMVMEGGTHAELMAVDGLFAKMVTRQVRLHTDHFDATEGGIDRL